MCNLRCAPRDDGERGKRGSATGNKAHLVTYMAGEGFREENVFFLSII